VPYVRIKIIDVLDLIVVSTKRYYNKKHKLIFFNIRDKVYLRLYKGYLIPTKKNKKLNKQRIGLLKVI
jgi:hypothetical protein